MQLNVSIYFNFPPVSLSFLFHHSLPPLSPLISAERRSSADIFPSLRQGKFYKFDVISPDGRPQSPLGIRHCLEKIVEMAGGMHTYLDQTTPISILEAAIYKGLCLIR